MDIDKIIAEELMDTASKTREALARRIALRVQLGTLRGVVAIADSCMAAQTVGGWCRDIITTLEQEQRR